MRLELRCVHLVGKEPIASERMLTSRARLPSFEDAPNRTRDRRSGQAYRTRDQSKEKVMNRNRSYRLHGQAMDAKAYA